MLIMLLPNNAFSTPGYDIYDLGALTESNTSEAYAINDYGQIVGHSGVGSNGHAFYWEDGIITDIGAVGGALGATDINNAGMAVGHSNSGSLINGAFIWEDGQMNALGMLPSGRWSYAHGINESGTVVGKANLITGNTSYYQAVKWENGNIIDLGVLENQSSYINSSQANAINDEGVIVGFSFGASEDYDWSVYAVKWENGNIEKLDTLAKGSQANDINNKDQIAGTVEYLVEGGGGTTYGHAALWEEGSVVDLGTLGEGLRSKAYAINEEGSIVGQSTLTSSRYDQNYHATLWSGNEIIDLNNLINPSFDWMLSSATDLNEVGQIVGEGIVGGTRHGFLLDPEWDVVISTGQIFLTDYFILDETFAFDYWWETGTEPTDFNLDVLFFNGTEWETFGWALNFDGSSDQWNTASFWVPPWLRGESTQIMFSLYDWGQVTDPTVYLRNIGSSSSAPVPEPATIILLGAGLLGIAGASRRKLLR